MNPLERISNAYAIFILAVRIYNNCNKSVIRPEMFQEPVFIATGGPGLTVEGESIDLTTLKHRSYNLMIASLGILSIVIDEASCEVWGEIDINNNLGKARAILHMLRCAFAHGPIEPKWKIMQRYQKKMELIFNNEETIIFQGDILNEQNLKLEDIGGLEGMITLMKFIFDEAKNMM